jgi:hypothetical protein
MDIDRQIIDYHKQLFTNSCIPSLVELVLKLNKKVPKDYYDLQRKWGNNCNGSWANFDDCRIYGLQFFHKYGISRGIDFPLKDLFFEIDIEITNNRYVLTSLASGKNSYHMWLIYKTAGEEYHAVSKDSSITIHEYSVKKKIRELQGTDILVYKNI